MSKKIVLFFDGSEVQLQVLLMNAIKYISQKDEVSILGVMVSEEIKSGMAGAWYSTLSFESSFEKHKQALLNSDPAEVLTQKYNAKFEILFNPISNYVLKLISDISPELLIIPHCQESSPIKRWLNGSPSINFLDKVTSNILFLTYQQK